MANEVELVFFQFSCSLKYQPYYQLKISSNIVMHVDNELKREMSIFNVVKNCVNNFHSGRNKKKRVAAL